MRKITTDSNLVTTPRELLQAFRNDAVMVLCRDDQPDENKPLRRRAAKTHAKTTSDYIASTLDPVCVNCAFWQRFNSTAEYGICAKLRGVIKAYNYTTIDCDIRRMTELYADEIGSHATYSCNTFKPC